MTSEPHVDYTLLLIGLGIISIVLVGVVLPNAMPNARGSLNYQRREHKHKLYELKQARRAAAKAKRKFENLKSRAQHVKPARLREAEEQAKDLETMVGHAKDRVMVAENHTRRIILDQYPPAKQQQLLAKYLPAEDEKTKSFTF